MLKISIWAIENSPKIGIFSPRCCIFRRKG